MWFLVPDPDDEAAAEIGWRLPRTRWGQGLATEGARALLTHAFETLGAERVWAETMAVNTRSRAVMERLGMRHTQTEVRDWEEPIPGWELGEVVYEVTPRHQLSTRSFAAFRLIPLCSRTTLIAWILFPAAARARASAYASGAGTTGGRDRLGGHVAPHQQAARRPARR